MSITQVNEQFMRGTSVERVGADVRKIAENTVWYERDTKLAFIMVSGVWEPFPGAVLPPQTQSFKWSGNAPGGEGAPVTWYLTDDAIDGTVSIEPLGYPALLGGTQALFAANILSTFELLTDAQVQLRVNDVPVATITVPPGALGVLPAVLVIVPVNVSLRDKIDASVTINDLEGQLVLSATAILF